MALWDGAFSDALEIDILKLVTSQNTAAGPLGTLTAPTGWGLSLLTTAPTADDGTGYVEVPSAGTSYLRIASTGKWNVPTGTGVSTSAACQWPSGGNFSSGISTVVGVGLHTSLTWNAGNLVGYMPLAVPTSFVNGTYFLLPAGALVLAIGGLTL